MGALDDFREQYPDYKSVPDAQLADGLYRKFYSEHLTREQFDERIGLTPAPAPAEPHYLNDPSMSPSRLGQNVNDVWSWIKDNKQEVADFIAQTAGTTAGIVGGTAIGGPPGAVLGGAAGNALAKKASRYLGGADQPSEAESAVDAGLGAAGPLAGPMLRGGSRLVTGLSRKGVTAAERTGAEELAALQAERQAADKVTRGSAAETRKLVDEGIFPPHATAEMDDLLAGQASAHRAAIQLHLAEVQQATKSEIDAAVKATLEKAQARKMGDTVPAGALGGAGLSLISAIEPITGALIGAGVTDTLLRQVVPGLLGSKKYAEPFARWALNVEKGAKPSEVTASLLAMAAKAGLDIGEKPATRERPSNTLGSRHSLRDDGGRFTRGYSVFEGGPSRTAPPLSATPSRALRFGVALPTARDTMAQPRLPLGIFKAGSKSASIWKPIQSAGVQTLRLRAW